MVLPLATFVANYNTMKKHVLISLLLLLCGSVLQAQDRLYSFNNNVDNDYATGNDGTPVGTVGYITDRFGAPNAALNLGGAGSKVDFGVMDSINGKSEFTIAAWFQKSPAGYQRAMFGNGSALCAYADIGGNQINAFNSCTVAFGSSFLSVPTSSIYTSIPVGAWYHYALVMRNGWLTCYINGQLYSYSGFTSPSCAGTFNFLLGESPSISTNNNWAGGVDDLFIITRGLKSNEVDSIKNLPNPCNATIAIAPQPSNVTVTTNSTVTFTSGSSAFGVSYQWQVSTNAGATYTDLVADATYSNVTTASLSVLAADSLNSNLYRVKVSDGTCTAFSNAARLSYPVRVEWTMDQTMQSTTGTNPFVVVTQAGNVGPSYTTDRFGNSNSAFSIVNYLAYENVTTSGLGFLSGTREFSYSAWYKVSNDGWLMYSAGAPNAVFKAYNNGAGAQQPTLEVGTGTNTHSVISNAISNTANTPSTWRHFVVSFKNGEAKMYVNGVLVSKSKNTYGKMPPAFSSFAITNTYISPGYFANGSFDDVMVCNWAIEQNEVDSLYNAPNHCAATIPITTQPSSVYLAAAGVATFTVASSASGLTYQWQRSTNNGATYSNITNSAVFSGATTATLTINADTSFVLNKFRCLLDNGTTCTAYQSAAASLDVAQVFQQVKYSLNAGSATNDFGTGYDGTILGAGYSAVPNRFGVVNAALQLNPNAYISTGNIPFMSNSTSLTINGWFKKEPGNVNNKYLYSKDGDIFFAKTNLAGSLNNSTQTAVLPGATAIWQAIPDTAWFMHTTVFNNGVLDIYINGTKVATATSANQATAITTGAFIIGGKPSQIAPSATPSYAIDDIYATNRAWSAATVDSMYLASRACSAYWVVHPSDEILYASDTITFTAIPSISAASYQWQVSTDAGASYTNVVNNATYSNATTTALTVIATNALDANLYRLVAFTPTCQIGSNAARLALTKDVTYNFNNKTAQNILGNNNPGTLSSGVYYTQDRFGNDSAAIAINGAGRYMGIGNLLFVDDASKFSYVAWYKKPQSANASGELFSIQAINTWQGTQVPDEYVRAYISGNTILATTGGGPNTTGIVNYNAYSDVNAGEWFQYSFVVDFPSLKTYINGKLYAQQTITGNIMSGNTWGAPTAPQAVVIGGYYNAGAPSWAADVDDIYISNKALTVTQLDSMRALPNPCPGSTTNTTNVANTLICNGSTAELSVRNTGVNYNWYNAATNGTLLSTGRTYTTAALTDTTTFFVEASMPGCTTVATRVPITVQVKPVVSSAVDITPAGNLTLCPAQTTTLEASIAGGASIAWYDAATGGNLLGFGSPFTTAANTVSTSYFAAGSNGTCLSAARTQIDVVVDSSKTAALSILPFSCPTNISGNLFRFPIKVVTPGVVSIGALTKEAISNDTTTILLVPGSTYTVNVNDNGCLASTIVTAPTFTPNNLIVGSSACQSCAIRNNKNYTFFDVVSNQKLVSINDVNNGTSLGNIDVCVNVDTAFTLGTTSYLGRNFHLTPDTSSNAGLRLFFTSAELSALQALAPGASASSLYVVAFDGQQETPYSFSTFTNYGPYIAQIDVAGNYYIDVPVTGFSGFYITAAAAQPLAIEDITVSASVKNNSPLVAWHVSDASECASFVVERSTNAKDFEPIATVQATSSNTYQHIDLTALGGTIYYRINTLYKSGEQKISSMVSVMMDAISNAIVLPNPTQGIVNITCTDFKSCTVVDMYGKAVFTSQSKTLDLSNLAAGQYSIIIRGGRSTTVKRIQKQ
jgi:hypothetical protein